MNRDSEDGLSKLIPDSANRDKPKLSTTDYIFLGCCGLIALSHLYGAYESIMLYLRK